MSATINYSSYKLWPSYTQLCWNEDMNDSVKKADDDLGLSLYKMAECSAWD